jgi:hypothetical protein
MLPLLSTNLCIIRLLFALVCYLLCGVWRKLRYLIGLRWKILILGLFLALQLHTIAFMIEFEDLGLEIRTFWT